MTDDVSTGGKIISIHALLAESDTSSSRTESAKTSFLSTLSLRRATARNTSIAGRITSFLSTLSLRRATICSSISIASNFYFYPRSPCGERPHPIGILVTIINFYPRSPCGERPMMLSMVAILISFLSTLSLRRATLDLICFTLHEKIFLSTLSLRRATPRKTEVPGAIEISIHALLAESDTIRICQIIPIIHFYPRSPCGERPNRNITNGERKKISIHALLAESDSC